MIPTLGIPTSEKIRIVASNQSVDSPPYRLVVGFGSGRQGFDTIDIRRDGINLVSDGVQYVSQKSLVNYLDESFEVINELEREYHLLDVSGGSQGFAVLFDKEGGKKLSYFNNYFPDEFRKIWKDIVILTTQIEWESKGKENPISVYNSCFGEN